MFIARQFIESLISEYGKHHVYSDSGTFNTYLWPARYCD